MPNPQDFTRQDSVLQYISSQFVSIPKFDGKTYRDHAQDLIKLLIQRMKDQDDLFSILFQREHVGGSFWDNLKVGAPEEFDINLILKLPSLLMTHLKVKDENVPASYIIIDVMEGFQALKQSPNWNSYRKIEDWLDLDGCMITEKVRSWMESVVDRTIQSLPRGDSGARYMVSAHKSGPAITMKVSVIPDDLKFQIDVVPTFEFPEKYWPQHVRKCPDAAPIKKWHVVPKPIKVPCREPWRLWRLSFHDQESFLIHGSDHFKAVLKFFKKYRDVKLDQRLLPSYAIKTVFLWEMFERDSDFWRNSFSFLFIHMLNIMMKRLEKGNIPFFWDARQNLLENLSKSQIEQMFNTFRNTYNLISKRTSDPFVIAQELLTDEEFKQLQEDFK